MRILHLKSDSCAAGCNFVVDNTRYEVVDAASFDEALWFLEIASFDVMLIEDGRGPDTVQFIADARIVRPEVPVFVTSAWGSDLPGALSAIEKANELSAAH